MVSHLIRLFFTTTVTRRASTSFVTSIHLNEDCKSPFAFRAVAAVLAVHNIYEWGGCDKYGQTDIWLKLTKKIY